MFTFFQVSNSSILGYAGYAPARMARWSTSIAQLTKSAWTVPPEPLDGWESPFVAPTGSPLTREYMGNVDTPNAPLLLSLPPFTTRNGGSIWTKF